MPAIVTRRRSPHEEPSGTTATGHAEVVRDGQVAVDDLKNDDALANANRQTSTSRQLSTYRRRPIADDGGMAASRERLPSKRLTRGRQSHLADVAGASAGTSVFLTTAYGCTLRGSMGFASRRETPRAPEANDDEKYADCEHTSPSTCFGPSEHPQFPR